MAMIGTADSPRIRLMVSSPFIPGMNRSTITTSKSDVRKARDFLGLGVRLLGQDGSNCGIDAGIVIYDENPRRRSGELGDFRCVVQV